MNCIALHLVRPNGNLDATLCLSNENIPGLIDQPSQILHPEESKTYSKFKVDKKRYSFLMGRLLAKSALNHHIGNLPAPSICIDRGIFEQPVIAHPKVKNIQVSIAHSGPYGAALAFPESHPMAIDIEAIDPKRIDAILTQVNPTEIPFLKATQLPEAQYLTLVWTIKEAISKVFRTGLMADFKIYNIKSIEKIGGHYESRFHNFGQYKVISKLFDQVAFSMVMPYRTQIPEDQMAKIKF